MFCFFKYNTFASNVSLWQQHDAKSDVCLLNDYTKFEKVLPITSKDIHHFINKFIIRE